MNHWNRQHLPGRTLLLAAGLLLGAGAAWGAEVNVTGSFEPSQLDPGNAYFKNTTPRSPMCNWRPDECARRNSYVFATGAEFTKSGEAGPDEYKDTLFIAFPPRRDVTLTDKSTGNSFQASILFNSFTARLDFGGGVDPLTHRLHARCSNIRGSGGVGWAQGGWVALRENENYCYTTVLRNGRTYQYTQFGLGMTVDLPNATDLQSGVYTAREVFLIGEERGNLNLGHGISGDSEIALNFEFEVKHSFQVQFPNATLIATLAPVGGWHQWRDYGRAPSRLQHELPFTLTSSNPFSVKMRCEHELAGRCGIEDLAAGTIVPVDVEMTMPGFTVQGTGADAIGTPLVSEASGAAAPRFTADSYIVNRPSKVTFSANGGAVTEMLKAPGSRWQGDVTLVFDSNP